MLNCLKKVGAEICGMSSTHSNNWPNSTNPHLYPMVLDAVINEKQMLVRRTFCKEGDRTPLWPT